MSIYEPLWNMKAEIEKKKTKIKLMQSEVNHLAYIKQIVAKAVYSNDENVSKSAKEYFKQWSEGYLSDTEIICHICVLLKEDACFYAMAIYYETLQYSKSPISKK